MKESHDLLSGTMRHLIKSVLLETTSFQQTRGGSTQKAKPVISTCSELSPHGLFLEKFICQYAPFVDQPHASGGGAYPLIFPRKRYRIMARNKESMNIPLKASQWSDVCSFLPISQHPTPVSDKKRNVWNIKVYNLVLNIIFNKYVAEYHTSHLPDFLVQTQHEDLPLNPEGQCRSHHDHLLLLESML